MSTEALRAHGRLARDEPQSRVSSLLTRHDLVRRNGLTENESSTLWSRDADSYISQEDTASATAGTAPLSIRSPTGRTLRSNSRPRPRRRGRGTTSRPRRRRSRYVRASAARGPRGRRLHRRCSRNDLRTPALYPGHLESVRPHSTSRPMGRCAGFVDYRVRVPNRSSSGNDYLVVAHGARDRGSPVEE